MLYAFDIDGTLIRSFMREADTTRDFEHICPRCGQSGTLEIRAGTGEWHCELCPWHGVEADAVYNRVEVLPGRLEKISELAEGAGSRFALVTNQGGVAFGYQTYQQVYAKVGAVVAAFQGFHTRPVSIHVAFWHRHAKVDGWRCVEGSREDQYRKPGPGMLIEAMTVHRTNELTTWFVGDMDSDRQAAQAAGVKYYDAKEFFR